jgi:hypothetical protein
MFEFPHHMSNGRDACSLMKIDKSRSSELLFYRNLQLSFGYFKVNGSDSILHVNWTRNPNNFLAEKFIGLPVIEWIQFILVAGVISGSILSGELNRVEFWRYPELYSIYSIPRK